MDEFSHRRAQKLLSLGLHAVSLGELERARDKFKESAEVEESADAVTYWGWMEHHLGHTDLAIRLCRRAIELDPEFGNPYNDIGSYLVSQGKTDEAIPWFGKAIEAKRYEPRQFPHINLGRIFWAKQMPLRALEEFKKALEFTPDDLTIHEIIEKIKLSLN